MTSYLVHKADVAGAATHALVVGVGRYPHLIGGSGPLYPEHGGMLQLTSPPLSANAFAQWLVSSYKHPGRELASVSMLVSGPTEPVGFTNPKTGRAVQLQAPTFNNLTAAVKAWKARGDTDPDNLMLFYFCGHGIANGPDLALVLQDFGEDPDAALESALDFRRFHLGMERCKARRQCFFIDACRSGDANIIDAAGYAGRPIFTPSTRRDRSLPVRQKPVFYSTFAGERAQSRTDKVSLFTEAVLEAFKGGGADDTDGDWWVDTNQLQKAVQFLMERGIARGFPSAQINPVDDMSEIRLHRLDAEPEVPVVIGCRPPGLNEHAVLEWRGNGKQKQRDAQNTDWDDFLELGTYQFSARMMPDKPELPPKECNVRPPYRKIQLKAP